jgi:hypothetical protein
MQFVRINSLLFMRKHIGGTHGAQSTCCFIIYGSGNNNVVLPTQ